MPETPQWLLSKNRTTEAEKSLYWLRGWVSSEIVRQEFNDMKRHSERSKSCYECIKQNLECTHPLPTLNEKFAELKRKSTLKPFFIVFAMFFLSQFTGILSMRPFFIQIFKAYDSPIQPDVLTTIMSMFDNFTIIVFMLLIPLMGKRRIFLFYLTLVLACTAIISWYGFTYLPAGYISFDQGNHEQHHLENRTLAYIPIICILVCTVRIGKVLILSFFFNLKT